MITVIILIAISSILRSHLRQPNQTDYVNSIIVGNHLIIGVCVAAIRIS